jgi:hydroxymethylglutaryl-CoA reductase
VRPELLELKDATPGALPTSSPSLSKRIVEAFVFADNDPYRAATHNKGIMNGVDPVVIATGNDWRAIEAGAHAYAARSGRYRSLSRWSLNSEGLLCGELQIPLQLEP